MRSHLPVPGNQRQLTSGLFIALASAVSCAGAATSQTPVATAFTNVSVISMESDSVLRGHTVLVHDGTITDMGLAGSVRVPGGARVIDGTGRYLLPGLMDMHVHLFGSSELLLYVANGVTTVRNMWGFPQTLAMRDSVRRGLLLGPRIVTAGALIDGNPPQLRGSAIVRNANEADSVVRTQIAAGYDFVKAYNRLEPGAYQALAAAASRHQVPLAGHVPTRVPLEMALGAGQASIEHLTGYVRAALRSDTGTASWSRELDETKVRRFAGLTRQRKVWNTPTLIVLRQGDLPARDREAFLERHELRYVPKSIRSFCCRSTSGDDMPPGEAARRQANRLQIVRVLSDSGARILLGTDTGNPLVLPGYSVAEELELLVLAGLSPFEAIAAATRDAAEFLGDPELGTIKVGNKADLLLIGSNPVLDVAAVRDIVGVMMDGAWHSAAALQQRIEAQVQAEGRTDR